MAISYRIDPLDDAMEQRHYRPEELSFDEAFNVRPYSTSTESEDLNIEDLSRRIELLGQLDPVRVILRNEREGRQVPVIYAGNRRRRAISLLNARISERSNGTAELRKVWCVVDRSGGDIRHKAWSSNKDRENTSAMDTASLICLKLRSEFGADGEGTKKISSYLGISKAGVIQYERLLSSECSPHLQLQIQRGVVTMDAALQILNAKAEGRPLPIEKQAEVVARAKVIQDRDAEELIAKSKHSSPATKRKRLESARAKTRVEAPAVKKAIKELEPSARVKHGVKDLKRMFQQFDSAKFGQEDGVARKFARYFRYSYLDRGDGTDEGLEALWAELVSKLM